MQAIANLVTASPAAIANVWQPLFPGAFSSMSNSHPGAGIQPKCTSMCRAGCAAEVSKQRSGPDPAPPLLQSCMSLLVASSTAACQRRRVHTGT